MKIAIAHPDASVRDILGEAIAAMAKHRLLWSTSNGRQALALASDDTPDLVIIDAIMPDIAGDTLTQELIAANACDVLIVTSSVHEHPDVIFQAMGHGALDAINAPCDEPGARAEALAAFERKLAMLERLRNHRPAKKSYARPVSCRNLPLVAIGSSTGGPAALATILAELPADLPAAVIVVQHVDPSFAAGLADWLGQQSPLRVRTADAGDRPSAGEVLIANSADHLVLQANGRLRYTADPENYVFRPSADVFFSSAAAHWPNPIVGVLLTGMGRDGAQGLLTLKQRGMPTIAQNRETCAVYGMPKAAAELGAASAILAVDEIAAAIIRALEGFSTRQRDLG